MAKPRDPEDVAASIQRSIEVSPKGSRRVRCHTLRALFGFKAWTADRRELVAGLLDGRGIHAEPPISDVELHDWVVLSLPVMPPPNDATADPRPSEEWFDHLMTVHLDTEREVEMYFASPLFHGLGYTAENEAAGFRFDMWEGVTRRRVEADLVYFQDHRRTLTDGVPLILVEAKGTDQPPDAGTGQVRSYSFWLKPAYYVITNGDVITVYNYQGGAVPDVKVVDMKRSELRERFDELYQVLNPHAAAATRQAKLDKLRADTTPPIGPS
jgi:Type I restriction enzyme R protein N terminus (HSDR_N)